MKPTCRELLDQGNRVVPGDEPWGDLAERVERVLALHHTDDDWYNGEVCVQCTDEWPCPTVRALDGEE